MPESTLGVDRAVSGLPRAATSEVWVCFELPPVDPPAHAVVLSFMSPSAEAAVEKRWGAQFLNGRTLIEQVRARAREEYVCLIARLGVTPCSGDRTLRDELQGPGGYSRWWFLDITEKDCLSDDDTTYSTILRLMALETVKDRYGIDRVDVHGAPPFFAAALRQGGAAGRGSSAALARVVGFGLLSRLALIVEYVGLWWTLRRLPLPPSDDRDVLLQAYWDWTVRPDRDGNLRDRYFTDLPAQLRRHGLSVGWLASFEPHAYPWQRGRKRREVLALACAHRDVTLLERYLTPVDILRVALSLRYPLRATRLVMDDRFRRLCTTGAFDLYPLIRQQILRAVWGRTFCRLQLVATATARACGQLRAKMVLTCFEMLLRSRALYAGARACSHPVRVWAAQHAGYSTDKTLGVFDPDVEVRGTPDGSAVPAPDGLFALGDLSRRIWEASGFASERVITTGGLRYQGVRVESRPERAPGGPRSLLLLGGMCEAAHLDLCDAAVTATASLPSVRIRWRDHPLYLLSERPAFDRLRGSITVTSGTVDEDLESADLVLFTQTGLAEEALLRGIPTWQWLWAGFNTSPFLDVAVIPAFTSVVTLRLELDAFLSDPARYRPRLETQRRVLYECFGRDPGGASVRIADAVQQMVAVEAAHT